ncbi:MAG: aminotransferase class IV [Terriglobales bacterium]
MNANPVHAYAWRNGRLMPTAEMCVSPLQTGLLSGWGLFSTLRIYEGVPFAREDHWERLATDGARLLLDLDGLQDEMTQALAAVIEANDAREAVARVYLIRNHGGLLDSPQARPTDVLVFTRALRSWGASARLGVQAHGRDAQAPLAGTKTLTWAHNLVLVEEAHTRGQDDVLLLNERGEVAECTSANVFVARGGRLRTPPLDSGALPGVSRKLLLAAAPRFGLAVDEAPVTEPDLYAAEEVFITSSTREVQAVTQIGAHAIPRGPLTARAAEVFRALVGEYVTASRAASRPASRHTTAERSRT